MKTILVAEVVKTEIPGVNKVSPSSTKYTTNCVSFDRDKLVDHIEKKYKIKLVKDEKDDFPYFTDGGFRYCANDGFWNFEITCSPYEIV